MLMQYTTMTKTFFDLFTGRLTTQEFIFSGFLVCMGALLWVLYRIKNRKDKTSSLSFKVWLSDSDNIISLIISIILTYISIRFYSNYQEYIISQLPVGFKSTPYFMMVVVGFLQHWLSEKINKLTI